MGRRRFLVPWDLRARLAALNFVSTSRTAYTCKSERRTVRLLAPLILEALAPLIGTRLRADRGPPTPAVARLARVFGVVAYLRRQHLAEFDQIKPRATHSLATRAEVADRVESVVSELVDHNLVLGVARKGGRAGSGDDRDGGGRRARLGLNLAAIARVVSDRPAGLSHGAHAVLDRLEVSHRSSSGVYSKDQAPSTTSFVYATRLLAPASESESESDSDGNGRPVARGGGGLWL